MDSIKERVPTRGSTEYARLKQTASEQKPNTETKKAMELGIIDVLNLLFQLSSRQLILSQVSGGRAV